MATAAVNHLWRNFDARVVNAFRSAERDARLPDPNHPHRMVGRYDRRDKQAETSILRRVRNAQRALQVQLAMDTLPAAVPPFLGSSA